MKKLILMTLTLMLCACSPKTTHKQITIEHKLGTTQIAENPKKIAVFDMGILDILDGVEIQVGAVPKASLPQALDKYKDETIVDAGTLFEPNYESLAEYQPDVIIISGRASKNYDTLSEIAPTLYLGTGSSEEGLIASIEENIKDLEILFPQTDFRSNFDEAKKNVESLNALTSSLDYKTMFILANGGAISSYGPGSRYDHVFNEFGFKPVSETFKESTHGDKLSFELVSKINPDILIIMDRGAIAGSDVLAKELLENEFIQNTSAYKENRIIFVDPQTWYLTEGGINAINSATKELLNGLD